MLPGGVSGRKGNASTHRRFGTRYILPFLTVAILMWWSSEVYLDRSIQPSNPSTPSNQADATARQVLVSDAKDPVSDTKVPASDAVVAPDGIAGGVHTEPAAASTKPALAQPTTTLPTSRPAGLACSPEWLDLVNRHVSDPSKAQILATAICQEQSLLQTGTGNNKSQTGIATLSAPAPPPRVQRWGPDGPAEAEVRDEGGTSLDSTACGAEMGDSSHPMTDADFLSSQFLAIGRTPLEQLSKAKLHFAESVAFAASLNRVLILPRVGRSWLSTDSPLPFCAYFDEKEVAKVVKWVTFDFYLQTSRRLLKKPSVKFMCSQSNFGCGLKDAQLKVWFLTLTHGVTQDASNSKFTCADAGCPDADTVGPTVGLEESRKMFADADLLVTGKDTISMVLLERFPHLDWDSAVKHVAFHPRLVDQADRIVSKLPSKHACIHFRWEKASLLWEQKGRLEPLESVLVKCVEKAVQALQRKTESNFSSVFVASDVSLIFKTPYRDTWNGNWVTASVIAMQRLSAETRSLNLFALENFSEQMHLLEFGTQGVLSKLVCQKTDFFFAGPYDCGGTHSFEAEIVKGREGRGAATERWTL